MTSAMNDLGMLKRKAKIIAIEGPDRVGKATQSHLLAEKLRSTGAAVAVVEVPVTGGFAFGTIYKMLKNGTAKTWPRAFQVAQFLNRWTFQKFSLPKLMEENDYIIFDRWSLSLVVYGAATGVSPSFNEMLYKRLVVPDAVVVLLNPPYTDVANDVYEADADLQRRVWNLYDAWCERHLEASPVDAKGSPEDVASRVYNNLRWMGFVPIG